MSCVLRENAGKIRETETEEGFVPICRKPHVEKESGGQTNMAEQVRRCTDRCPHSMGQHDVGLSWELVYGPCGPCKIHPPFAIGSQLPLHFPRR